MLGGLRIELAVLKAIGSWIEDSGWTNALVQAGVTTPGTADSFLKASQISRTLHAHQVTASSLFILMHKAYSTHIESVPEGEEPLAFRDWRKQAEIERPHFHYWSLAAYHPDIR